MAIWNVNRVSASEEATVSVPPWAFTIPGRDVQPAAETIRACPDGTNDLARSKEFYDALLPIIGLSLMAADESGVGYGSGVVSFSVEVPNDLNAATVGNGVHIAVAAENRGIVHSFYGKAVELGGTGNGEPGLRPRYGENYYGAFVRDPDGNKIEAVTCSAK